MKVNLRREPRRNVRETYSLCWQDGNGHSQSVEVRSIDRSHSGIRVNCPKLVPPDTLVFIQAEGGTFSGHCVVRHCTPHGDRYRIGLEFNEDTRTASVSQSPDIDYYEFLQINPKADSSTIQRIYRLMASRFHPDNPETGDPEKFLILNAAYKTLSDPDRRAAYDASLLSRESGPLPIFELSEFVNDIEGEVNRRLGVLSLLYNRRRTSPQSPGVSLFDMEKLMGMPREYLDFTTWYLKSKQYITIADNSEFALTADGVDYVESNHSKIPILQKLLQSGPRCATASSPRHGDTVGVLAEGRLLAGPETKSGNGTGD
ncbi:MAG TPA: DnaJ domain-containing protein [Bryobacteraceae bacterium]|jgi:hypothetical protein